MKLIEKRICKLEGNRVSAQIQYIVVTQILERRQRRLLAAGIHDEPVEAQLKNIRDRSNIMHQRFNGAGLAEQILARRRMRQEAQSQ